MGAGSRVPQRRTRSPHPGVVLIPPQGGHPTWRARCEDPDTGKRVKVRLDPNGAGRNAQTRRLWAIERAQAIARRKDAISSGAPRATGTALDDAVKRYFDDHPSLRASTRALYRGHADAFLAWASAAGLTKADDVTRASLVAYRAARGKAGRKVPAAGKKGTKRATEAPRAASSINIELRAVRTILNYLRRLGLAARLSSDDLSDGLKRFEGSHEAPMFLRPPQLAALLRAARQHDAETFKATREEHAQGTKGTTPRYQPIASIILVTLLSGMRFGEVLELDWSEVDLAAGEIRLTARTKTKRARTIDLSVSPALVRLLLEQAPEEQRKGRVWKLSADQAKAAAKRLDRFGAPAEWTWQALRRTCGTYLTNAPGIFGAASAYRSARQLGHSVTIAERHYLGVVKVPKEAMTLEEAMGLKASGADLIAALS